MAAKQNRESELATNKHGQGFPDRPQARRAATIPIRRCPIQNRSDERSSYERSRIRKRYTKRRMKAPLSNDLG
jgi:hypothetical protein